jgi:hypothetical protein
MYVHTTSAVKAVMARKMNMFNNVFKGSKNKEDNALKRLPRKIVSLKNPHAFGGEFAQDFVN